MTPPPALAAAVIRAKPSPAAKKSMANANDAGSEFGSSSENLCHRLPKKPSVREFEGYSHFGINE